MFTTALMHERRPPRIKNVPADIVLYPERRGATIRVHYDWFNKIANAIPELHVALHPELKGAVTAVFTMQ